MRKPGCVASRLSLYGTYKNIPLALAARREARKFTTSLSIKAKPLTRGKPVPETSVRCPSGARYFPWSREPNTLSRIEPEKEKQAMRKRACQGRLGVER